MIPQKKAIKGLYAVTPDTADTALLESKTVAAIKGGARVVQYRNKTASPALRREQARVILESGDKILALARRVLDAIELEMGIVNPNFRDVEIRPLTAALAVAAAHAATGAKTTIVRAAAEIDAREAAELARIRKKLKLTQLEAAQITGGGPNAFSRYEPGNARPLPAVTNLFRLLDRHPELLNELQQ